MGRLKRSRRQATLMCTMPLSPAAFIAKKRDGGEHSAADLKWMVASFLSGEFTDYQMTAWLMAVYLRGLTMEETLGLTGAMLHSGALLDKKRSSRPRIDKHSTGGVGDKVSLPLAPLCAACGLDVPMIAGRGLGHTGGTLDKLESIPGFSVNLSVDRFERVVAKVGAAIMGQTEELAPADRRMYALRDVTGTVACRPLIVASILSKKLAESLDGLVLDVKVGRGAFMSDAPSARRLAKDLVAVSGELGTPAVARLSNMHQPLGVAIGNALEVRESLAVLRGQGPSDTRELTLALAADMCLLGGVEKTLLAARLRAEQMLDGGFALERFAQMIEMQGGDARVVDDPGRLPIAPQRMIVRRCRRGSARSAAS